MVAVTVVFVIPFTATAVHASLLTPPEMLSGIEKQNQSLNISWDALWRAYQRGKNSQLDVGT